MTVTKPGKTASGELCPVREFRKSRTFCRFPTPKDSSRTEFPLDNPPDLWYYREVKLGCFATVPKEFDGRCEETRRAPLGRGMCGRASRPGRIMTAGVFYRRVDFSLLRLSVPAAKAVGAALLPDLPHFLSPPGATRFRYTANAFSALHESAFGGSDGPEGADGKGTDGT